MTEQELKQYGFKTYKVDIVFVDSWTEDETICGSQEVIAKNAKQAKEKAEAWLYSIVKYWAGGEYKFKAKEI